MRHYSDDALPPAMHIFECMYIAVLRLGYSVHPRTLLSQFMNIINCNMKSL